MKKILSILIVVVLLALVTVVAVNVLSRGKMPKSGLRPSPARIASEAKRLEKEEDFLAARTEYQKLVNEYISSPEMGNWQKKIEELNMKLLFSPTITKNSLTYEVKAGDSLDKISKEFNTTVELIMKSNGLSGDRILRGQKLKVWTAPVSIIVDKSQNILILKTGEDVFKTYIVATGANNSTPIGVFKIVNKLRNPTWFKSGAAIPAESPENILGSRWLGFNKPSYGIHGTTEPENLGKQVTQGCVRMSNQEVEELYAIVPVGTEVTIVD